MANLYLFRDGTPLEMSTMLIVTGDGSRPGMKTAIKCNLYPDGFTVPTHSNGRRGDKFELIKFPYSEASIKKALRKGNNPVPNTTKFDASDTKTYEKLSLAAIERVAGKSEEIAEAGARDELRRASFKLKEIGAGERPVADAKKILSGLLNSIYPPAVDEALSENGGRRETGRRKSKRKSKKARR